MKLIAVMLLLALAAPSSGFAESSGDHPLQADFTLPQLGSDQPVSLSDFRGQWVVVNYWATWCAPCRKEIPELSELHREREDVVVLGLAYEDTEEAVMKDFLEEFQPSFPILLPDVYDLQPGVEEPRVLPTSLVVDPEGRLVERFMKPVTLQMLEEVVGPPPGDDGH